MQTLRRAMALLLCLCMVMPYVSFMHAHAAEGAPNVTLEVDKATVNVGDTVTVVISNAELNSTGFGIFMEFDSSLLECTSITGVDDDEYLGAYYSGRKGAATWVDANVGDTVEDTNKDGIFSFGVVSGKDTTYFEGTIATLTFTAKAAGTATFTLNEQTAGTDAFKGVAAIQTITIVGSEPECKHENATSAGFYSNNDGTHYERFVCGDCGTALEDVTGNCAGGTATCTEGAKCSKCLYEYQAALGHKDANKDHVCDNGCDVYQGTHADGDDANHTCDYCGKAVDGETCVDNDKNHKCDECGENVGEHKSNAKYPCQDGICEYCGKTIAASAEHTDGDDKDHLCDYGCGTVADDGCHDGNDQDHNCDECGKEDIEGHTESTKTETTDPTCTEEGRVETVTFCTECGKELKRVVTSTIPATNHSWGAVSYNWNANNTACEAVRVCQVETCKHEEKAQATVTSKVTAGTCQTEETTVFTAAFTVDWAKTQTKTVIGEKDTSNHVGTTTTTYVNNGEDHTKIVTCECGKEISRKTEEHTYVNHKCVCGAEEHVCAPKTYVDNGDGTHDVKCECGKVLDTVAHDYDETTHKCVCGAEEHICAPATYVDNRNGTHDVKCDCGKVLDTVAHDYDETTHKCVCGAVEMFVITMDANGGVFSNGAPVYPVKAEYGVPFNAIPKDPTREGYTFTGWNTKADGTGESYDPKSYRFTVDLRIYAQWKAIHVCAAATYVDNGDGTHAVKCDCGKTIEIVAHTYENHVCVCGAKFTGWEGKVYFKDAVMLTGWNEIEGAGYYLNPETGVRAEGLTRVPYPTAAINGITYAPDADALAYNSNFIDAKDAWFVFGEDGKLNQSTGLVGSDKYAVNGMLAWHPGLVQIGEDYYYFIGDVTNGGNIGAEGDTYITRNNGIAGYKNGDVYNFANGKLSGAHGIVNGKYYENSRLMLANGLTEYNGGVIYVKSNGHLVTGDYFVTNLVNYTGTAVKYGDKVTFGADGFMVASKNGIINGKYYINNMIAYGAGVVEIAEGKFIYVCSNGDVVMNKSYWITNVGDSGLAAKMYYFDADGILQNPQFADDLKENIINGYYYKDGVIAYGAGLIEYKGGIIYVRSNGKVATGKYWVTNTNGLMEAGFYTFGEDGMMIN